MSVKELFINRCKDYVRDFLLSEDKKDIEKAEVVRRLFSLKLGTNRISIKVKKDGKEYIQTYDIKYNRNAYPELNVWRKRVFARDNYTCQRCNKRSGILNAHHKETWVNSPALRFVVNNGITLCAKCHKVVHRKHLRF